MSLAKRKSLQAGLVILIAVAIILAGAFAWYSFTQQALNIFEGFTNPNVNLHDDFDGKNKDVYVENNGQRPLYVRVRFDEYMDIDGERITTAGNKDEPNTWPPHFYMGTGDAHFCDEPSHQYYTWVMGNSGTDTDDGWKYYMPSPFSHRALFDRDGYQLLEPLVNAYDNSLYENAQGEKDVVRYGLFEGFDPELIYTDDTSHTGLGTTHTNTPQVETPEEAYIRIDGILEETFADTAITGNGIIPTDEFTAGTKREYLDWLYAELDKAAAADNRENDRLAIQAEIGRFLKAEELGYWDITYTLKELAANEYYTPSNRPDDKMPDNPSSVAFNDSALEMKTEQEWVPIKRTITAEQVYTMSQWIADGMPIGDFWIMDADGWCYWGNVLLPTQTTGLLMSEVLLNELNPPAGVWWYGINVTLQATTAEDIGRFAMVPIDGAAGQGGGIRDEGQMVLDSVSSKYVFGVAETDIDRTTITNPFVKASATFHTYQKFGDNTYRLVTPSGNSYAYGPLFIYTGATSASADAMRGIYDKYTPEGSATTNGTDNSEYKVGTKFWKQVSAAKWAEFTVIDAKQGTDDINNSNPYSGVYQAKNGKHYVKLGYGTYDDGKKDDDKGGWTDVVWLAVGENGVFDQYVANNSKAPSIVPAEFLADPADVVSDNDDALIWTEAHEPGIVGADRYVEEAPVNAVKIGDVLKAQDGSKIDGHDWLVIGRDVNNSQGNATDKTLIIAQDVSAAVASGDITTTLAKYKTGDTLTLTTLVAADSAIDPFLLSPQEAMDYFANNTARIAKFADGSTAAKWWIDDGKAFTESAIDTNGSFGADTTGDVGIRIALWVDTVKLNELVYGTP